MNQTEITSALQLLALQEDERFGEYIQCLLTQMQLQRQVLMLSTLSSNESDVTEALDYQLEQLSENQEKLNQLTEGLKEFSEQMSYLKSLNLF